MALKTLWHAKTGKATQFEPIDAREILAHPKSEYVAKDPNAKEPETPVEPVALVLPSNVPSEFDLGKRKATAVEVAAARVKAKGMSAESWNMLGDGEREKEVLEHVEVMKAQELAANATANTRK
jgi:hypothetical protein